MGARRERADGVGPTGIETDSGREQRLRDKRKSYRQTKRKQEEKKRILVFVD